MIIGLFHNGKKVVPMNMIKNNSSILLCIATEQEVGGIAKTSAFPDKQYAIHNSTKNARIQHTRRTITMFLSMMVSYVAQAHIFGVSARYKASPYPRLLR
jgi:hypothetical protein